MNLLFRYIVNFISNCMHKENDYNKKKYRKWSGVPHYVYNINARNDTDLILKLGKSRIDDDGVKRAHFHLFIYTI